MPMRSPHSFTLLSTCLVSSLAFAQVPEVSPVPEQRVSSGQTYTYAPTLVAGDNVIWTKAYGPGEISVAPESGLVRWQIPTSIQSESYHLYP